MAFLDNSGDIILDAVLTDTGRLRLAQGDGSFKISKFALGDDEINYALYNKNHASGSAYYDLEVLQTPILEAFTNNTSNLKTKFTERHKPHFVVAVDKATHNLMLTGDDGTTSTPGNDKLTGVVEGYVRTNDTVQYPNLIRVDQGLDTTELSPELGLDQDLLETAYIVESQATLVSHSDSC